MTLESHRKPVLRNFGAKQTIIIASVMAVLLLLAALALDLQKDSEDAAKLLNTLNKVLREFAYETEGA